jgi:hypothetical protein
MPAAGLGGGAVRSKTAQQFGRDGHDQGAVFSAATTTTVCSSRSCKAAGSAAMTAAAWASFLDAWYSLVVLPGTSYWPRNAPFGEAKKV